MVKCQKSTKISGLQLSVTKLEQLFKLTKIFKNIKENEPPYYLSYYHEKVIKELQQTCLGVAGHTNFIVIGLTRLEMKPESAAPEADVLATRPSELLSVGKPATATMIQSAMISISHVTVCHDTIQLRTYLLRDKDNAYIEVKTKFLCTNPNPSKNTKSSMIVTCQQSLSPYFSSVRRPTSRRTVR